jgi:hypothetical protein
MLKEHNKEGIMTDQKDRKLFEMRNNEKELSKPTYSWLAQYEEDDVFLCGKVSNSLSELIEEE